MDTQRPKDKLVRHAGNPRSVYYDEDWPGDNLALSGPHSFPPSMEVPATEDERHAGEAACTVDGFHRVGVFSYDDQRRGGKVRGTPSIIVRMT